MKNVHIQSAARLGNFIIQLKNAIQIALFYNYNIILPEHKYINTTYLVTNDNIAVHNETITDENNFLYQFTISNIDCNLFKLNRERTCQILKSIFTIKNETPLGENDLIIHMRSGDIFEERPHPEYIMPPLSFYVDIIKEHNYNDIYLIAEDRKNPCINALLELYPTIKFKLQSLEEDIQLIMGATNIVLSYGTFIPSLLILSNKIRNCYRASYMDLSYMNFYDHISDDASNNTSTELIKYNIHTTELTEYKNKLSPWRNTETQRKIMLNYQHTTS